MEKKFNSRAEMGKENDNIKKRTAINEGKAEKLLKDKKQGDAVRKEIQNSNLTQEEKRNAIASIDAHKKEVQDKHKEVEKSMKEDNEKAENLSKGHGEHAKEGKRLGSAMSRFNKVSDASDRKVKEGGTKLENEAKEHAVRKAEIDKNLQENRRKQAQIKQSIYS